MGEGLKRIVAVPATAKRDADHFASIPAISSRNF